MTSTAYVIRRSRYVGAFEQATIRPAFEHPDVKGATEGDGFVTVTSADGCMTIAADTDIFDTEAEARAAAKANRKPRQPKQMQPLYGDFAQLAAFNGIRTDGSGRKA